MTITPSHGITVTVPAGGYYTSGTSGSYYVYTTAPTQGMSAGNGQCDGSVFLCYTCALTPTVVTGCPGGSGNGANGNSGNTATTSRASTLDNSATVANSLCTPLPGIGTTTLFTTDTITSCGTPAICPVSGYFSGGNSTQSEGIVATTTHKHMATSTATTANLALPTCPYSNGFLFSSPMGMLYTILCDEAFADETLQFQNQTDLASCISACDMVNVISFMTASPCLGVTFYPEKKSKNCLIKTGSTTVHQRGADSARLLTPYEGPSGGNGTEGGSGPGLPGEEQRLITITQNVTQISTYGTTAITTVYQPVTLPPGTVTLQAGTVTLHDGTVTLPASPPGTVTITATTVSVSISISDLIVTETTTAPGPTVTTYIYPSSTKASFTCRTVATNYLDGNHGKVKRADKRSIFDADSLLLFGEMGKSPRPGAVAQL